MNSYPYKALDVGRREIRLLVLDPAQQHSHDLTGSLTRASLNENPSFEALSYTWGQPPFRQKITIDDSEFLIGANLTAALRELRSSVARRTLWIDAICINQYDDSERRQQVPEIQHIFTAATKVLAWIGEADEHGDVAMSLLEGLQEQHLMAFRAANFMSTDWIALKKFWARSYWRRIWVVQELAVAGDRAMIGCGSRWILRSAFDTALDTLLTHRNNHDTLLWEALESEMDWFLNLSLICRSVNQSSGFRQFQDLEYLLYLTEHFEATEPLDHFFALLGLSQEEDRLAIPADYSRCFADTCAKVLLHIIQSTESLNVLSGNRCQKDGNLSSWMPSFSDPVRRGYGWNTFRQFRAAGSTKAHVNLSLCRRVLSCKGIEIGTISDLVGPFENSRLEFFNVKTMRKMRSIARATLLTPSKSSHKTSKNQLNIAFWETLFANRKTEHEAEDRLSLESERLNIVAKFLDEEDSDTAVELVKSEDAFERSLMPFSCNLVSTLRFRCFFGTSNGFIGVGPYSLTPGDLPILLLGADVPFILRSSGDEYHLVGDAYVYGVMNGEMLEQTDWARDFQLK